MLWKFSVIEWKHRISGENVFSGLSKAQFTCPVQHFEKMMIKVDFTFCGLFTTLCVLLLWQESYSGVSKPQTKCTEEKFSEIFSVANVFSKHFQSLSRDNWSFSKKVPAWLSQLPSMGPEEHFGITIWGKFLNISIFFGKLVKFPRKHRKIIFRVDRTAKSVWRKKLRKNLFQEKKTYYFNFFQDFARSFFYH